jgi:hypothetical protein
MADNAYFMCLLNWRDKFVPQKKTQDFEQSILQSNSLRMFGDVIDNSMVHCWPDWRSALIKCTKIDSATSALILITHSRLIIKFSLANDKNYRSIAEVRKTRHELEEKVKQYLSLVRVRMSEAVQFQRGKGPRIFSYATFELSESSLWQQPFVERPQPATLSTTCFFAKLPDLGKTYLFTPKQLRLRISGAKIITEEMSSEFFWNLTNVVFHKGLYKQQRDRDGLNVDLGFAPTGIHFGLENRLEDFSEHLIITFSQTQLANQNTRLNQSVLVLTLLALIAALVTVSQGYLGQLLLKLFQR